MPCRVLPVIITGRLPFFPLCFAGSSACPALVSVLSHMKYLMVKTLAGIVPSIPLELGFCSLQISHTSCCPFFVRVPPITTMGGYAGSCPSFLRVLPIAGMGGYAGSCPGRCPFGLRVLPITGMGGRPFVSGSFQ